MSSQENVRDFVRDTAANGGPKEAIPRSQMLGKPSNYRSSPKLGNRCSIRLSYGDVTAI